MLEQTLSSLGAPGHLARRHICRSPADEEALAHEAEPEAAQALKREAVLAAIVEAEQIEPTDEQVLEALGPAAEREQDDPAEAVRAAATRTGAWPGFATTLASRQAVELLVDQAKPISVEQAQAREKLWTPEQRGSRQRLGAALDAGLLTARACRSRRQAGCYIRQEFRRRKERSEDHEPTRTDGR